MDNLTVASISSVTTLAITTGIYIIYRLCYHFHMKSKCCGRTASIDWDTGTPTKDDDKKDNILKEKINP
jgi:hypothetical protein